MRSMLGRAVTGAADAFRENQINYTRLILGAEEDWHYVGTAGEPGFNNNWINYTLSSLPNPVAFRRDSERKVHIKGVIDSTLTPPATPPGELIFTLPVDYRPEFLLHPAVLFAGAPAAELTPHRARFGQLDIHPDGRVGISTGFHYSYVVLDNIIFHADS
jgi:hypothetical protein